MSEETADGRPTMDPPADRPSDMTPTRRSRRDRLARYWWLGGLAVAVVIVVVLAPLASPDPDGLESVAKSQGFIGAAQDAIYRLIPDYQIPGLGGGASTIVAGLIGIAVVFGLMILLGRILARRRN